MPKKDAEQSVNIFDLLEEASEEEEEAPKSRRAELLESISVKECFKEGNMKIDMRTCRGIECNLCVKACPTNALYWKAGEIGIVDDLCIYCTACVANCMVDDCIRVTRKRPDGKIESFSNPKDVLNLQCNICSNKRRDKVKAVYPTIEEYFERHGTNK
ncbi:4Fe-4S dicluster domain-containing protein [Candidatus Bathyarchaeota archaeon]|nr:4Fe-4S dicluster domain-containing protein [Candidatus Bathyarchaeota archaeon]